MTNPRPKGGRPSELDAKITISRPGGTTQVMTVADRIVELMGTGAHVDTAAMSLGITRKTLHDWLKIGARANKAISAGRTTHPDDPNRDPDMPTISAHEARCMQFSSAVDAAQGEWVLRQEATLEAASRPSQKVITTVTTDAAGNTTTATRTEATGPDLTTVRWRMERHPATRATYGAQRIEISGPDGGDIPVEVRVSTLADKIAALRQRSDPDPSPEEHTDASTDA